MFLQKPDKRQKKTDKEEILRPDDLLKAQSRPARSVRAPFFASLRGSLTVEAALVLPLFLFCMTAALQYCVVMETAVKFGTALAETGKNLAITAYVGKYGGETDGSSSAVTGILSAAYAQSQVSAKAGDTSSVKSMNMLLSSFQKDDTVDLVLTYQVRSPFSAVKLPGTFFIQRARVRSWTGRTAAQEEGEEGDGSAEDVVYVTETGRVYHEDPNCTHLRLSIHAVDVEALPTLRNNSGAMYRVCEKCGAGLSSTVYITDEGNRYHSSLSCSGLKRTVKEVAREDLGALRACSKCGSHEED